MEAPNRINIGNADVILGFDLLGVANPEHIEVRIARAHHGGAEHQPDADHRRDPRPRAAGGPRADARKDQHRSPGAGATSSSTATALAEGLFGSHLAVNLFMVGVAYQGGLIPLSLHAIEQAIRLNEVDVEKNLQVFEWGRKYYHDAQVGGGDAWPEPRPTRRCRSIASPN